MNVVQINAVYEYSSTGRTTTEMHEELCKQGIASYVFCTNKEDNKNNIFRFSSRIDQYIHSALSRILGLQGLFSYWSTKKLLLKLKSINPDVVHLRVLHSNCINLPLLLRYLAKNDIATVLTLHDCWYFTGHCCYFVDSNCNRWKNSCGHCPDIKDWNPSYIFDTSKEMLLLKQKLFSNIRHLAVIGVSDWVTGYLKDSILHNAQVIKRIYNWIDFSKFTPRNSKEIRKSIGIKNTDFVVLGVAQNWTPSKGLASFIEIANRCPNIKFAIVGNIFDKKLPSNIISLGVVSDVNLLIDYYSMADVFFNPSIRETFGKVTIEALAAGTPSIVYDTTASPELIKDGCGYIVATGDVDAVIVCLNKIRSLGKHNYTPTCREFAFKNFQKEKLVAEYIRLYKDLCISKTIDA